MSDLVKSLIGWWAFLVAAMNLCVLIALYANNAITEEPIKWSLSNQIAIFFFIGILCHVWWQNVVKKT